MSYEPVVIVHNLVKFFEVRGWKAVSVPVVDKIINDMTQSGYVRLDAKRATAPDLLAAELTREFDDSIARQPPAELTREFDDSIARQPRAELMREFEDSIARRDAVGSDSIEPEKRATARGSRDQSIVIILSAGGPYQNGPKLEQLLKQIASEPAVTEGRLDELIFVVNETFLQKSNLTAKFHEEVEKLGSSDGKADPKGDAPYCNLYPDYLFAMELLKHKSLPKHRLLSSSELDKVLEQQLLRISDLPIINIQDPPVVWIGGRVGDVVAIKRNSDTASQALYYRRVTK